MNTFFFILCQCSVVFFFPLVSSHVAPNVWSQKRMEGYKVKILEFLVSDFCVYSAIFLPLVLLLLNFVFGSCFLSDTLHTLQTGKAASNIHSKAHRVGRVCVILVVCSFAAQYYVYFHVAHSSWNGESFQCSPVDCILDLIIYSCFGQHVFPFQWRSCISCRSEDVTFLVLWLTFLFMYIKMVCSSVSLVDSSRREHLTVSFCRHCQVDVDGMDHHCFMLCNCIGARNRKGFLGLLCVATVEVMFFNYWSFPLLVSTGEINILLFIGLLFAVGAATALTSLLVFHVVLWKTKRTTKDVMRSLRKKLSEKQTTKK